MNRIRTTAAAFAVSLGAATLAVPTLAAAAADEPTGPCAVRQAQVDRAEDALARVTAVFERQQDRVAKAKKRVAKADTRAEKRSAKAVLARAKDKKSDVAKDRKAQKMRLTKALERLEDCLAAPTEPTEPAPAE
ncbi:hypothetical protein [Nocardioides sp. TF02-7]|uniref:hypothetical protein n=1 Tax=Nocardioides sp. TF02-7 TaxID=2917724 RepID=UPI001F067A3B|nr:hypothetical protein [Nocardioides sp. TF02-7]UMG92394.1 hypothetical protein MF408_21335 [Nocardioides sp. TF02-7]